MGKPGRASVFPMRVPFQPKVPSSCPLQGILFSFGTSERKYHNASEREDGTREWKGRARRVGGGVNFPSTVPFTTVKKKKALNDWRFFLNLFQLFTLKKVSHVGPKYSSVLLLKSVPKATH